MALRAWYGLNGAVESKARIPGSSRLSQKDSEGHHNKLSYLKVAWRPKQFWWCAKKPSTIERRARGWLLSPKTGSRPGVDFVQRYSPWTACSFWSLTGLWSRKRKCRLWWSLKWPRQGERPCLWFSEWANPSVNTRLLLSRRVTCWTTLLVNYSLVFFIWNMQKSRFPSSLRIISPAQLHTTHSAGPVQCAY